MPLLSVYWNSMGPKSELQRSGNETEPRGSAFLRGTRAKGEASSGYYRHVWKPLLGTHTYRYNKDYAQIWLNLFSKLWCLLLVIPQLKQILFPWEQIRLVCRIEKKIKINYFFRVVVVVVHWEVLDWFSEITTTHGGFGTWGVGGSFIFVSSFSFSSSRRDFRLFSCSST